MLIPEVTTPVKYHLRRLLRLLKKDREYTKRVDKNILPNLQLPSKSKPYFPEKFSGRFDMYEADKEFGKALIAP